MKFEKDTRGIKRYIAFDIHKEYALVGGQNAQQEWVTAHLIARVVYRMLKYQVEYEPLSVLEYEKHYHEQQVKYLQKRAAKFGFLLRPT